MARLFRVSRATVAKWVRRFREGGLDALQTAPAVPCAAPARPISCRKWPSALLDTHSPGGRTASGGGWALPAPPTLSCAAPDSTASRGSIAPHARSSATSMPARATWSTWTSRSSAASRRAAASASCPASARPTVARPPPRFRLPPRGVDDHSRYAYVEALPDERGATAAAFLVRALAHFGQDIAVEAS